MAFSFKQATEIRDTFGKHAVKYLFIGKSGAIILGYPDTTQDSDVYVEKTSINCQAILEALIELRFVFSDAQKQEILRGKILIQLKNGPFDMDIIFAPDGIERFDDAWKRRVELDGFPVCNIDDIIASKQAANRQKDRESLGRLLSFRDWLNQRK